MVLIAYGDRIISNELVFPSPCGDYGSYHEVAPWEADEEQSEFPSPCGDYGSYRPTLTEKAGNALLGFRPLAGIMVLIFGKSMRAPRQGGAVSVPLRGLWFLSVRIARLFFTSVLCFRPLAGIMVLITARPTMNNRKRPKGVSVPLRGLWFLSLNNIKVDGDYSIEFPSPCGDYGSYQAEKQGEEKSFAESFRPLAGIMVLITGL